MLKILRIQPCFSMKNLTTTTRTIKAKIHAYSFTSNYCLLLAFFLLVKSCQLLLDCLMLLSVRLSFFPQTFLSRTEEKTIHCVGLNSLASTKLFGDLLIEHYKNFMLPSHGYIALHCMHLCNIDIASVTLDLSAEISVGHEHQGGSKSRTCCACACRSIKTCLH